MTITAYHHVPLPPLSPERFRRAREIASAHGGVYCNRLTNWRGTAEIPPGYLFRDRESAEIAAAAVRELLDGGAAVRQGALFTT